MLTRVKLSRLKKTFPTLLKIRSLVRERGPASHLLKSPLCVAVCATCRDDKDIWDDLMGGPSGSTQSNPANVC